MSYGFTWLSDVLIILSRAISVDISYKHVHLTFPQISAVNKGGLNVIVWNRLESHSGHPWQETPGLYKLTHVPVFINLYAVIAYVVIVLR